ncbi:putative hydrolase [Escherichia coli]|uniref:Putative hydrolase n=1 Tax=Escherichia coli TaxID=562 RepID=A0A484WU70_ECOLX|nr:putative hydrolase [Escherichia coli]
MFLNGELSKDAFTTVVEHLLTRPEVEIIACGKNSAYTLKKYDDAMKTVAEMYYHRLEYVDNFDNLEDIFFKFGLNLSDELIPQVQKHYMRPSAISWYRSIPATAASI